MLMLHRRLLFLVFASATVVQAQDASMVAERQRQVLVAEEARRVAIIANDTAALNRLIAETFVGTLNAGDVKSKVDEVSVNARGTRRLSTWRSDSVEVRVFGQAAIVTGRAYVTDELRGNRRAFSFRFTHVWIYHDGRWQLAA